MIVRILGLGCMHARGVAINLLFDRLTKWRTLIFKMRAALQRTKTVASCRQALSTRGNHYFASALGLNEHLMDCFFSSEPSLLVLSLKIVSFKRTLETLVFQHFFKF